MITIAVLKSCTDNLTLKPGEFIRRFLIHVLPNGFHRIRHCGLLASGTKAETIARARELIAAVAPVQTVHQQQSPDNAAATDQATHSCPCCGGRMNIIETFKRGSTPHHRPTGPIITVRTALELVTKPARFVMVTV